MYRNVDSCVCAFQGCTDVRAIRVFVKKSSMTAGALFIPENARAPEDPAKGLPQPACPALSVAAGSNLQRFLMAPSADGR
jgi:hypothetical protein